MARNIDARKDKNFLQLHFLYANKTNIPIEIANTIVDRICVCTKNAIITPSKTGLSLFL